MRKVSGHMRRRLISILAILTIMILMATTAFASQPHFGPTTISLATSSTSSSFGMSAAFAALGSRSKGGVTFTAPVLSAKGLAAGLGPQDVIVQLLANGAPKVLCFNPKGNSVPGQNPPKVTSKGNVFLDSDSFDKNGSVHFDVTAGSPQSLSSKQLGCPNDSWTAVIPFVNWTDGTLTLFASDGTTVLDKLSFTCVTTETPLSSDCTLFR
jgi:hypothetical protein